jgi:hypothetical protein
MRKPIALLVAIGIAFVCPTASLLAQDPLSPYIDKVLKIPARYITKVQKKYADLDAKLTRQTERYLSRMEKEEKQLNKSLSKYQSKITSPLTGTEQFYNRLIAKVDSAKPDKLSFSGEYQPLTDSVETSLSFLHQYKQYLATSKGVEGKLEGSVSTVKQFQAKLQATERIRELIKQRKEQIKQQLQQYTTIPAAITRSYTGYSKELYYYSTQLNQYKELANDPDKLTQKALNILRQSVAYQEFAKKYSQLASMFGLPASYGSLNLGGLQTRSDVTVIIQNQLASGGPGGMQVVTQNLQAAQAQLNQLKDKLQRLGKGSADMDLPNFKPNNQHTKSFWQRLEYGTNLQTVKNHFFPTTTDLGVSVGYKLTGKSTIGVGASYKMGWGNDIQHIHLTNQGMGLRSFLDIKLKGSFFASGGFEYNYQPLPSDSLSSASSLHWNQISSWKKSGLIGVSKVVSIKSKFFKKTKVQLLWDFLSYQQTPASQPFKFRVGYNF